MVFQSDLSGKMVLHPNSPNNRPRCLLGSIDLSSLLGHASLEPGRHSRTSAVIPKACNLAAASNVDRSMVVRDTDLVGRIANSRLGRVVHSQVCTGAGDVEVDGCKDLDNSFCQYLKWTNSLAELPTLIVPMVREIFDFNQLSATVL